MKTSPVRVSRCLTWRCSRHAAPGAGVSSELRRRRTRLNFGVRLLHLPPGRRMLINDEKNSWRPSCHSPPLTYWFHALLWTLITTALLPHHHPLSAQAAVPHSVDGVPPEADRRGSDLQPIAGLRQGAPLGWSIYGGIALRPRPASDAPRFGYSGYSLLGEVGQAGGCVSVGPTTAGDGGTLRLQLSAVRTWKHRDAVPANQTYLGPEALLTLFVVGGSVGSYWRLNPSDKSPRHFFSVNLVVGL
jgi:hypothetical protein